MAARQHVDPTRFLPLKPTVFHILISLAEEDRYGYAIIKEVEKRTGGAVTLKPGAFYRILARTLADGLLDELDERPATVSGDDVRRRYYGLTPLGRSVAAAEIARMEEMAAAGRARGLA